MQFHEDGSDWREWPGWAGQILNFGFSWPEKTASTPRRIAILSLPCDSAAAGLIALGAMRRRLTRPNANDVASHMRRIDGLDHTSKDTVLRHISRKGRWAPHQRAQDGILWVKRIGEGDRAAVLPYHASHWYFEGEAPVEVIEGRKLAHHDIYSRLVMAAEPAERSNLTSSDSSICLAARASGSLATRGILEKIKVRSESTEATIAELLTIHSWTPNTVSRVSLYNPRTGGYDRNAINPILVVADGDSSLHDALTNSAFQNTDIIGAFHRVIDRDRLEAITNALTALSQWYDRDELLERSTILPAGVTVTVMKKR